MPVGLRIEREEYAAVVVLEGEQESYQSTRLEPQLDALLREGVPIVVDLSEATFVDSTTIAVLLAAQGRAQRGGSGFVLEMDESTAVYARRIFEITGLEALFSIRGTRREAVTAALTGEAGVGQETEPA
jgi:anti-sigma B factor antagonist